MKRMLGSGACGWLTRIDARIKVVAALTMIVNTLVASRMLFPALVAFVCLVRLRGMAARQLVTRLAPPVTLVLIAGIVQTLMRGGPPLVELTVLGHSAALSSDGLAWTMLLGSRVLATASVLLLLCHVTADHDLFSSLRWLRVPSAWLEVATLTFRYLFVLGETANTMLDAHRLRLGACSIRRRVVSAGLLAGSLLVRSMEQAESTHQAMLLRGYGGAMPAAKAAPLGRAGYAAVLAAVALPTLASLVLGRIS